LLLRDNDMLRKWEDVTTTDTFTMYYASVFRGRFVFRLLTAKCIVRCFVALIELHISGESLTLAVVLRVKPCSLPFTAPT
jgi:hypothetical protein